MSNLPTQEDSTTLNTQLEAIRSAFFGYVPGPVLVTPWAIDRPIEQAVTLPNREMLIVDNATTDERAMELIVEDWLKAIENTDSNTPENHTALAMVLGPALDMQGASSVEAWSSIGRLARKAISFWWAASSTGLGNESFNLELRDAWQISPGKRGQVMPAPEIVVWRTLATHLGGRTAIEELDLMPGVRMLLAGPKPSGYGDNEHDESGILVLWLDDPSIDNRVLSIPLSMSRVTQIDVFNNQTNLPLEYIGDLNLPVHRITIGRSPIIVTEVNTDLVRFLSAIELTPNTLQSRSGIHKHALVLTNPWGATIRGRVYIVEPGGYTSESNAIDRSWEITPRVVPFVLDAYESREMPIDIAFSLGEIAGDKKLTFDVELQADADYPLMRIERSIELKLDGVEMQLTARRGHDGITVVAVAVTNKFDTTQNFELIAIPPNESRLRRAINSIKPGQRVVREFAFRKTNPGDQVIVTLLVPKSSTRINKVVRVP
ncbi:MAG: hypothetical protein JKX70_02020 [Phycisphaerales bacterium]|nr:hypothetical protein [Phycisphaerales bacterium]